MIISDVPAITVSRPPGMHFLSACPPVDDSSFNTVTVKGILVTVLDDRGK